MGTFQGRQSYCSSETSAAMTADACRKRNKQAHLHRCSFLGVFFRSCHHLFSLTENMIISLPPMWFAVRKGRQDACVCVVRQRLEELVIVFVHLSLLDAPCMSLTLSLIIRYTTSCWGGQVLLGLSYIHPQSSASCTHTHTYIYT